MTMKIAVVGASGETGAHVLEQALENGDEVVAIARTPSKIKIKHQRLDIVYADILDGDDLAKHFDGCQAVISCLGASIEVIGEVTFLSESAKAIVSAMERVNLTRLVVISAWGVENMDRLPWYYKLFAKTLGRGIFADMFKMESFLQTECHGINFTAVRAPALSSAKMNGGPILMEPGVDYSPNMKPRMPRADVARCLLQMVEEKLFLRKCVAIGFPC